jgi:phage protein D
MLNDPNSGSTSQSPRGLVFANGQRLAGLLSFSVENNNFFHADTFQFTLVISEQSAATDLNWWSQQEKLEIELFGGLPDDPDNFDKTDLASYMVGYVDDLEFDLVGDQMTFTGRDLTSKLIDTKNTLFDQAMKPLTASKIVSAIAAAVGLQAAVTDTPEATPSGTYYQIIDSLLKSHCSYWDIVSKLAQIEGFQTYVVGHTLYFEPRAAVGAEPYVLQWTPGLNGGPPASNAVTLHFTRNLSIAKDLKVEVMSFNPKSGKTFKATATRPRAGSGKAVPFEQQQTYVFNVANKTQAQVQAIANAKLQELSLHEMNLSATMPADPVLTPRNLIQVRGTGTAFDQAYFATSIRRNYSRDEGFMMTVLAKNQTPNEPTQ